jgi:hypothetical protein
LIVVFRDFHAGLALDHLIDNQAFRKFFAHKLLALRTVLQPLFHDAWPHRAALVDQLRIDRHAPITADFDRGYAKTEISLPAIAQFLLVGWILGDIWPVSQAKVTTITTPRQNWSQIDLHMTHLRESNRVY